LDRFNIRARDPINRLAGNNGSPVKIKTLRSKVIVKTGRILLMFVAALAASGQTLPRQGITAVEPDKIGAPIPPSGVMRFPLSDVRLLDGPFKQAQEVDRNYLLALDINRLLAPIRIEAGLKPKAEKYPNWESSGLDGHTAGHYLTAVAQMWAATGDGEMKRRLDAMVEDLAKCQRVGGDGYVGGIPCGRTLWKDVAAARIDFKGFSLNGAWVP
jgi:hypothetical protein